MLPQLPRDKANHVLYGALVFNAALLLVAPLVALGLVAAVAAAKELSDWAINRRAKAAGQPKPHGVEFLDAVATFAGGLICLLPLLHF